MKMHLISIRYKGKLYSCFYYGDVKNIKIQTIFRACKVDIPRGVTYTLG